MMTVMRARGLISIAVVVALLDGCRPSAAPAVATHAAAANAPRELPPKARLARAQQRLELSGYREAEADFRALLASPEVLPARLGLGETLVTTGRFEEAQAVLAPLLAEPEWNARAASWTARAEIGRASCRERV